MNQAGFDFNLTFIFFSYFRVFKGCLIVYTCILVNFITILSFEMQQDNTMVFSLCNIMVNEPCTPRLQ